jgi:hypothetical protein
MKFAMKKMIGSLEPSFTPGDGMVLRVILKSFAGRHQWVLPAILQKPRKVGIQWQKIAEYWRNFFYSY